MMSSLNIDILRKPLYSLMKLEGRLDTLNTEQFSTALQPEIDHRKYIIIDFSRCNYLSSSGIRILITISKALAIKGGLLMLTHLPAEIFQILEMAGLHTVFPGFSNNVLAEEQIVVLEERAGQPFDIVLEDISYLVDKQQSDPPEALCWNTTDLAGYNELGVSIGIGTLGEKLTPDPNGQGLFFTLGNCAAIIPFNTTDPPEFRVVTEAKKGAIFVSYACSFPGSFHRKIQPASARYIHLDKLLRHVQQIMEANDPYRLSAFLVANPDPYKPSLTLLFETDKNKDRPFPEPWSGQLSPFLMDAGERSYTGIRFMLDHLLNNHQEGSLMQFINRNLTLLNIESVRTPDMQSLTCNPVVWVFTAAEMIDSESSRVKIEVPDDLPWESYKNYLVRNLYIDSARVVLHPLHGGYSAQTFQSDSFDDKGRHLRPTVLKIADRDLITREAERCQKYALPYIMNNSAMILGTSTFLNQGALRYNFVGIGGEQSRLQWLTHYYNTWPVEKLEPLFDKIFQNILKPWYGQPVREKIFLYRDHNPTRTFFPRLCAMAEELFSISADEKQMKLSNEDQSRINPYWFLKHQYPARENQAIDYYKSVCHGDLNMQNILIDDQMNVYLIDFSETRPRSVVSDFARLEAILMVERAPLANDETLNPMMHFADAFYSAATWDQCPEIPFTGKEKDTMSKNLALIKRVRTYARRATNNDENIVPYCLALLEWVLPIVCYQGVGIAYKKLSAYIASRLCDTILQVELHQ